MKHIKTYEKSNTPKVGDYGLFFESNDEGNDKYDDMCSVFVSNNVGEIVDMNYIGTKTKFKYIVKYENIPEKLKTYFYSFGTPNSRGFFENELVEFEEDKNSLEVKMSAKKYNL